MIFTTKRYAEPSLRAYAKSAADKAKGRYVARGKKTIADLVGFASKAGQRRLTIIGESADGERPRHIIEIFPGGRWRWD